MEVNHGGSIHTIEISKCYQSSFAISLCFAISLLSQYAYFRLHTPPSQSLMTKQHLFWLEISHVTGVSAHQGCCPWVPFSVGWARWGLGPGLIYSFIIHVFVALDGKTRVCVCCVCLYARTCVCVHRNIYEDSRWRRKILSMAPWRYSRFLGWCSYHCLPVWAHLCSLSMPSLVGAHEDIRGNWLAVGLEAPTADIT